MFIFGLACVPLLERSIDFLEAREEPLKRTWFPMPGSSLKVALAVGSAARVAAIADDLAVPALAARGAVKRSLRALEAV